MAWIEERRLADGSKSWWVRDRRDGRQIVIAGGATKQEAEMRLEQYTIRRDLEKEGHFDRFNKSEG